MSCLSTVLQSCPNMQGQINDYFLTCNSSAYSEPMPFAEFITSALNKNGVTQLVSPGQGKTRTVELVYSKMISESETTTDQERTCTATTKRGNCVAEYTIDTTSNIKAEELVSAADLETQCRDNGDYFQERLAKVLDVLERAVATQISTDSAALIGNWSSNVTSQDGSAVANDTVVIKTLKDSSVDPYPTTMSFLDLIFQQTGYCGGPVIFAGTKLYQYYQWLLAGCCSSNGVSLEKMLAQYGKAIMYDYRIANALGGNDYALATQQKAMALLHYTLNNWKDGVPNAILQGSNYFSFVATTPRLGIPVDITVKDDCGSVSIVGYATTKLVALPDGLFPNNHHMFGVNFVNKLKVTNV